ncbi:MAG TPA: glycosyltransferase family 39 protein [Victivallales bacterium]|nr:glycosyltransferase family 39 protein [Victivallales bacterium]HRU01568.1 glycosyltransferase family 39 protein [Victivallales bacterium]
MEKIESFIERNSLKWFFFIFFIAIFFRIFNISVPSLWTDEISTLWVSSAPGLKDVWERASATQGMHPLYFLLQHIVISFLPESETVIRGISCTASIISVFLIFWLAKIIFNDEIRPLISAAIFAIHSEAIYYAQEARPYALAMMFALSSMISFFGLRKKEKFLWISTLYVFFTVLTVYMHYTFASLLLFQNIFIILTSFVRRFRDDESFSLKIPLKNWIILQLICVFLIALSFAHINSLYHSRNAMTWIRDLDFQEAVTLFISMFDLKIIIIMFCVSIIFYFFEKVSFLDILKRLEFKPSFILLIWLLSTFIFIFSVSKILKTPLFDPRYMLFAMPAYYLLLANFLDIFRSDILRTSFPGTYFIVYLGLISTPLYADNGSFCNRIQHDWKRALLHIRANYQPDDAILLRYGEIKENWIPDDPNILIKEYVSAPFRIFYWKKGSNEELPPIFNLTFIWDKRFYPYYDKIFNELCKHKRVWLIGVNPPNTNYKIQSVAKFMCDEFSFNKVWESDFSGLYLCLLESNPILRQKYLIPSYYKEIREEIKKQKKMENK